jgi:DNA-binding CsgD family transcriptional regulator
MPAADVTALPTRRTVAVVNDLEHLRPIERRVTRLAEAGMVPGEIGRRFHRSPTFIERVLVLASLPGRDAPQLHDGLTPLERRLLRWRDEGAQPEELADRFGRGPEYIERVLSLADYKREHAPS